MIRLQVCNACKSTHYPERDICPSCWRDTLDWQQVSPLGRLTTSTVLHTSVKPEWADKLPLQLGLVKLDAGPNILTFLSASLNTGTLVTLTFNDGVFTAKETL
ncbi:MAG: OB-fold domain-containing protein [Kordiimonadaceae bacterium]|nr:OB-fold domain-containing protein [Kordiimonadaceae bacterium]MBV1901557.1 OB-fold domain-containing protein [Kordiimonadaceae bacterium]